MGWDQHAPYDHKHNAYDIYGTAATEGDVSELRRLVSGLREDLSSAEQRIGSLESQLAAFHAERGDAP
jgi:hypothetical protein